MQITERDIEIIKFINDFGFCEINQIERQFGIKKSRGYQIMKRLVNAGLVNHEKIFHGEHGIFYVTQRGSTFTGLPPIKNIPKDNYRHQLAVINTFFKLKVQYPEAEWISERRIKREKYMRGLGKRGHIPDGILIFPNNREIGIEVELTLKSKARLQEIFRNYVTCLEVKEVWYYCAPTITERLRLLAEKIPFLKFYHFGE
jgi:predicted DNA-binding transcriptional regulator